MLHGRLRLRLDERDLTFVSGEAAEFDTRIPHPLAPTGGRPAEVISIFNQPGARIHTHTIRPEDAEPPEPTGTPRP